MTCVWIGVFVVCALVVFLVQQQIELRKARVRYRESLELLKADPHNPDLREEALLRGREYARLAHDARNAFFEIQFTELMLMNDINAACARAGSKVTIEADSNKPTIDERLVRLDDLRAKQLISDAEYDSQRKNILNDL